MRMLSRSTTDTVYNLPAFTPSHNTQAIGTVMGTMFGFVSAALLTPTNGEHYDWMPAAPGVVSALGELCTRCY